MKNKKNISILYFCILLIIMNHYPIKKKRQSSRSRSKIVKKIKKNKKALSNINKKVNLSFGDTSNNSIDDTSNNSILEKKNTIFKKIINEIEMKINKSQKTEIEEMENIKKKVEDAIILINQEITNTELKINQISSHYNSLKNYADILQNIKNRIELDISSIDNQIENGNKSVIINEFNADDNEEALSDEE